MQAPGRGDDAAVDSSRAFCLSAFLPTDGWVGR